MTVHLILGLIYPQNLIRHTTDKKQFVYQRTATSGYMGKFKAIFFIFYLTTLQSQTTRHAVWYMVRKKYPAKW